jgi:poly(3-hydroxybutyrate) depolymerase
MIRILTLVILSLAVTNSTAQIKNQIFEFEFQGFVLNGVLNLPKNTEPKGIVLIVHGSGQTNAVEQNWYSDVRETILKAGYGTYMWDKWDVVKAVEYLTITRPLKTVH